MSIQPRVPSSGGWDGGEGGQVNLENALAKELGLLRLGVVSIDGTKIDAIASKIKSVRYDRALALREKLASETSSSMRLQRIDVGDHGVLAVSGHHLQRGDRLALVEQQVAHAAVGIDEPGDAIARHSTLLGACQRELAWRRK